MKQLLDQIKEHEGFSSKLYRCPEGKLTIGYGFNVEAGITEEQATALLAQQIIDVCRTCSKEFKWFDGLPDNKKRVVADMVFNMGMGRFKGFKKMIKAIEKEDYEEAAKQMLDSKWAAQVGKRAITLSEQMLK